MITVQMLDPYPAGNPLQHDTVSMGTNIGTNAMVLHTKHHNEDHDYIIVVNPHTGDRVKINFNNEIPTGDREEGAA